MEEAEAEKEAGEGGNKPSHLVLKCVAIGLAGDFNYQIGYVEYLFLLHNWNSKRDQVS